MNAPWENSMPSTAASPLQDLWSIVLSKVGASAEFGQAHAQAPAPRRRTPKANLTVIPHHLSAKQAYVIVKMGIPSRSLAPLSTHLGIGKGAAAGFLGLDRATATRKVTKDEVLPNHAAESMLRLLELDTLARDTFETPEEAAGWLRQPHPMLEGEAPLDFAKSSFGAERVKDILNAIKYGGVV
jgi:putative toxin-antitoxin system antitoxin component (TIGR02293 family)